MSEKECHLTRRIAAESAAGRLSEELAAHIALCVNCGETLRIANMMRAIARATPMPRALPTTDLLLWKSRLLERRAAQERATKHLIVVQAATFIVAALTLLWWANRNSAQLGEELAKLKLIESGLLASFQLVAQPLLIASVCVTLTCLTLAFAFRKSHANK